MKEERFWILLSKKIAGEASPEELDMLASLISDNPGWKTILENLQELWNSAPQTDNAGQDQKNEDAYLVHVNRLKEAVPDFDAAGIATESVQDFYPSFANSKPFYKRWYTYAAAATVIAALVFSYPLLTKKATAGDATSANLLNEITVNPGSRTRVQLPDGSQVWVNSGSKLTYEGNFKGSLREVQLDGEAYFDVVKDPAHPFIVHTSGIDIKVLGTAFDVKAYDADPTIEATLIHGSIEVINKSQPGTPKIMLKPHEKLVYNKSVVAPARDPRDDKDLRADIKPQSDAYSFTIKPLNKNLPDSSIIETSWVYNRLTFEDERFADLALKMERWYNVKISINNDKLKNYRISGSFANETVEEALRELQFLVPFNFSVRSNEIQITKK